MIYVRKVDVSVACVSLAGLKVVYDVVVIVDNGGVLVASSVVVVSRGGVVVCLGVVVVSRGVVVVSHGVAVVSRGVVAVSRGVVVEYAGGLEGWCGGVVLCGSVIDNTVSEVPQTGKDEIDVSLMHISEHTRPERSSYAVF